METKKMRYDGLDGLRAIGALGILMMHVLASGDFGLGGYFFETFMPYLGDLVFPFMVISGFSLCCGYYERMVNRTVSLEAFYTKRFTRVWPFFAVLCLMDFAVSPNSDSFHELLADLTLGFGLIPAKLQVIGVGWFLGVVFVFYLLFPFFCYLLSDKRRAWLGMGVFVLLCYLAAFHFRRARVSFAVCGVYFMAGCMMYLYRDALRRFMNRFWYLMVPALGGAVAVYCLLANGSPVEQLLCLLMTLVISVMMVLFGLRSPRHKVTILINPVTKKLSELSMEIYLSHMVIFSLLNKLKLTGLTPWAGVNYALSVVVTLIGSIVFSIVLKKLLELAGRLLFKKKELISHG